MIALPKGRRHEVAVWILVVVGLVGVMLFAQRQIAPGPHTSPTRAVADFPVPDLQVARSTTTLYILPVPEGSDLVEQKNVNETEDGKIQSSFGEEALESYQVDASRDAIAAFFRYHLRRHGWEQGALDVKTDEALTLKYCMQRYSWTVEISIAQSEPSGITEFQVRGEKK